LPRYTEYRAYSPVHDAEMARLSIWDNQGREYWTTVVPDGRGWADRRRYHLDTIMDAIEDRRVPPGEVEARPWPPPIGG
jgi:hypothetical protein